MSSKRQRSIPLGGRYRQVSLYHIPGTTASRLTNGSVFQENVFNKAVCVLKLQCVVYLYRCIINIDLSTFPIWVLPICIFSQGQIIVIRLLAEMEGHAEIPLPTTTAPVWLAMSGRTVKQVTWWRHQMEAFSALLALSAGNSPATVEFPSQRPVMRSYGVFFWSA